MHLCEITMKIVPAFSTSIITKPFKDFKNASLIILPNKQSCILLTKPNNDPTSKFETNLNYKQSSTVKTFLS